MSLFKSIEKMDNDLKEKKNNVALLVRNKGQEKILRASIYH